MLFSQYTHPTYLDLPTDDSPKSTSLKLTTPLISIEAVRRRPLVGAQPWCHLIFIHTHNTARPTTHLGPLRRQPRRPAVVPSPRPLVCRLLYE